MSRAFILGKYTTVDEFIGGSKGKALPGLMHVPRKPTPNGRKSHATACAITGVICRFEMYVVKERMETKTYVIEHGKNLAKAMRSTKI